MKERDAADARISWIELLVVFDILGILLILLLPVGSALQMEGAQVSCEAHAMRIGRALKSFAEDHNGVYPRVGTPAQLAAVAGSNDAFACLFPAYCRDEKLFANSSSFYNTKTPDNRIDPSYTGTRTLTLANGENAYAYMMNLTESGNPAWPLVMDAPSSRDNPTYPSAPAVPGSVWSSARELVRREIPGLIRPAFPGGVWDGRGAIIIHLDSSGSLERVDPASSSVKRTDVTNGANMLIPVAAHGTDPGWASGGVLELPQ